MPENPVGGRRSGLLPALTGAGGARAAFLPVPGRLKGFFTECGRCFPRRTPM
ncbi:hypothetical protein ACF073_28765 [Streptomyces sp. NPDC015171]|uniref:hypothetical protein n=1 Tax=Streptomyces sp. NPDC015171 TaxID=3364945 RepID=UPI0036F9C6DD